MTLTACPVCSHAVTSEQSNCPKCDWSLLPMIGVTPDEANARLAKARADWAKRHGEAFHQGEPSINKSPFETEQERLDKFISYINIAGADDVINPKEHDWLMKQAEELELEAHVAKQMIENACKQNGWQYLPSLVVPEKKSNHVIAILLLGVLLLVPVSVTLLLPENKELDPYLKQMLVESLPLIANRYRDNLDGTITDTKTYITWKRCSEGQTWNGSTCTGTAKEYTWVDATKLIRNKPDWRLPNIKELNTLVYCSNGKVRKFEADGYNKVEHEGYHGCGSDTRGDYQVPTINTQAFPATPSDFFWSSSPYANDRVNAWGVDFHVGDDYDADFYSLHHVRLVRGEY